ncbi:MULTISPECIES: nitrogen fixation protein NifZ [unclassified Bradyrhizobium]|uniref:nitrogen fixation protein NifZ n=1 Tax=unclassified Bradyrhizobium TaxID=2631580 RepID=UPI0024787F4E|nr:MULTISPECIES: nitrogen fixation protein NifZ [unclassified Bradyrhizobium]WGR72736.1 nitrogen fixation protein NifZ [Bradyrhizobium sp. ISRA426]WGR77570.1 nitrogen fixation protein NifZ [Bradyrhizobium sp. ISRA430]WGR87976.1 nitrogen fixation protein NifZ [Bradyrhizobium sp. ISRA432]
MTQPGFPKYRRGQRVKTAVDLINDHSFPDTEPEGVLLAAGATGEIINVAIHTEANMPIYIVDFGEQLLIGCLEEEITML